jgi:hypothetical protein
MSGASKFLAATSPHLPLAIHAGDATLIPFTEPRVRSQMLAK